MINQMSRRFGSLISVVMAVVILQLFIYVLALYPIEWIQHSLQHAYIGNLSYFIHHFLVLHFKFIIQN